MSQNSLIYFVDEIRTPFVINDLKRIAEKFESVILFSVNKLEGKEALLKNVVVFEEFIDWKSFKPLKILFANLFSILGIYFLECISLKKILNPKQAIALLVSNIYKAESIIIILKTNYPLSNINHQSFYSFWFYDCIYLAWMKKKGMIGKAITRAHGGDLFEERGSLRDKILFRNFQLRYLDKVLSVSNAGTEYLKHKYSKQSQKICTLFLGSEYHSVLNTLDDKNEFVIVSCARIRNIKRIHKIAEMLQYINFPITWYHIGDENLQAKNDPSIALYLDAKTKLQNKKNVKYSVMGLMSNEDILNFYSTKSINLFISLSEAEGIPVSMMEAISFGIPLLSTDVGGCNEIVNEQTGILIPLETSMEDVAKIITEFKDSEKNRAEYRAGVRKFWEENFDAEKNYEELFEVLER